MPQNVAPMLHSEHRKSSAEASDMQDDTLPSVCRTIMMQPARAQHVSAPRCTGTGRRP
eukprot:CAMPEP_0206143564 /NCGR_PEP_ID=MMETSP1473-20131121/21043_1 /ASSEMBLY_ACC=CAM_ASM_001109 /TAXON_ID=1461547 /ORGANISM="Stichococcus sp, Strain RCC1054" /LENGTH=57 /DNA_ID=CAMNT_0053539033 /DNA_START=97 /DNA_END=266 /DNA_ORIENTATION=-